MPWARERMLRRALEDEMRRSLIEKRFGAVLLESDGRYGRPIVESYPSSVFRPVTGGELRPEALCRPR